MARVLLLGVTILFILVPVTGITDDSVQGNTLKVFIDISGSPNEGVFKNTLEEFAGSLLKYYKKLNLTEIDIILFHNSRSVIDPKHPRIFIPYRTQKQIQDSLLNAGHIIGIGSYQILQAAIKQDSINREDSVLHAADVIKHAIPIKAGCTSYTELAVRISRQRNTNTYIIVFGDFVNECKPFTDALKSKTTACVAGSPPVLFVYTPSESEIKNEADIHGELEKKERALRRYIENLVILYTYEISGDWARFYLEPDSLDRFTSSSGQL